jgi:hypothetical protein
MTTIVDGTLGVTFPAGGVGNPAGAVVGTTDTQTLTNKTLTGAVMNGTVGATTPAAGAFTTLSATGITTVAAGSAALPAIVSTTGTADTGLWFPAADTVAASTAGTERLRIDSSGNVGIGIAPNAAVKLQVNTATNQDLIVNSSSFVAGGVGISAVNDAYNAYTPLDLQGTSIQFGTGGTERMRIDSGGSVGIGTTSPGALLHVGTITAKIRIGATAGSEYLDISRDSATGNRSESVV